MTEFVGGVPKVEPCGVRVAVPERERETERGVAKRAQERADIYNKLAV